MCDPDTLVPCPLDCRTRVCGCRNCKGGWLTFTGQESVSKSRIKSASLPLTWRICLQDRLLSHGELRVEDWAPVS